MPSLICPNNSEKSLEMFCLSAILIGALRVNLDAISPAANVFDRRVLVWAGTWEFKTKLVDFMTNTNTCQYCKYELYEHQIGGYMSFYYTAAKHVIWYSKELPAWDFFEHKKNNSCLWKKGKVLNQPIRYQYLLHMQYFS